MILTNAKTKILVTLATTLTALFITPAIAQEAESTQEERRAAFDACLTTLGIEKPEAGQRPQTMDEEVREQIDACMKEKGFEPPKHRRGGGGPPPEGGERRHRGENGGGVQ